MTVRFDHGRVIYDHVSVTPPLMPSYEELAMLEAYAEALTANAGSSAAERVIHSSTDLLWIVVNL